MPIYEYRCGCGNEREIMLPVQERNQPQLCLACGKVMQRKLSVPLPAIFRLTGRDMALDSLNSKHGGLPSCDLTPSAQRATAAGLEEPPKTIW